MFKPTYLGLFPGREDAAHAILGDLPKMHELMRACSMFSTPWLAVGRVVGKYVAPGVLAVGVVPGDGYSGGFCRQYSGVDEQHPLGGVVVASIAAEPFPPGFCHLKLTPWNRSVHQLMELGPWPTVRAIEGVLDRLLLASEVTVVALGHLHVGHGGAVATVIAEGSVVGGKAVTGLRCQAKVESGQQQGFGYTSSLGADEMPGMPVLSYTLGFPPGGKTDNFAERQDVARITDLARRVLMDGGKSGLADLLMVWPEPESTYAGLALSDTRGGSLRNYPGHRQPDGAYRVRVEAEAGSVIVFPRRCTIIGHAVEAKASNRRVYALAGAGGTYTFNLIGEFDMAVVHVYQPDIPTWVAVAKAIRLLVEQFMAFDLRGSACAVLGVHGQPLETFPEVPLLVQQFVHEDGFGLKVGAVGCKGVKGASVVAPPMFSVTYPTGFDRGVKPIVPRLCRETRYWKMGPGDGQSDSGSDSSCELQDMSDVHPGLAWQLAERQSVEFEETSQSRSIYPIFEDG